jgi:hypothetical protein
VRWWRATPASGTIPLTPDETIGVAAPRRVSLLGNFVVGRDSRLLNHPSGGGVEELSTLPHLPGGTVSISKVSKSNSVSAISSMRYRTGEDERNNTWF